MDGLEDARRWWRAVLEYAEAARVLPPQEPMIDECLDKRLATELTHRGRKASVVSGLGLRRLEDPHLFTELGKLGHPYVIVTADTL
jgi:hypothetical protein